MKSSTTKKRLGMLRISALRLDFQPTENLIEDTVQMYVNRLERGEKLPSLRVRFDGRNYFHKRLEAVHAGAIKIGGLLTDETVRAKYKLLESKVKPAKTTTVTVQGAPPAKPKEKRKSRKSRRKR